MSFGVTFINYNQSLQSCGIIVSFTFLVLFFGFSNSEPYSNLWFPNSYIGTWWQFFSQQSIFCWRMIKNVCRCNTSIKNTVIFLLEGHSVVLAYFTNVIFSMFHNHCWFLELHLLAFTYYFLRITIPSVKVLSCPGQCYNTFIKLKQLGWYLEDVSRVQWGLSQSLCLVRPNNASKSA